MIQKPSSFSVPNQFENADGIPAALDLDLLTDEEPIPKSAVQQSGFSKDEALLKEEALRNAVIEIEALRKTAAQVANARSEGEQRIRSEIEGLRRIQEQRIEEAHNGRRETANQLLEELEYSQLEDVTGTSPSGEVQEIPADVLRMLNSDSPRERSVGLSELARVGGENAFHQIGPAFDDDSELVRNAAAIALFDLYPDRAASFARALREGSFDRCRRIGAALAKSGLAGIAIDNLAGRNREKGYEAFSLLFLMTKAGEVEPLLHGVEHHPDVEVRLALVKLLALNGQSEIIPAFRQLAVRGVLPTEVRAAVIEAIYEIGRQIPRDLASGTRG